MALLNQLTNWAYLRNPFENVTRKSFRLMQLLAKDHCDKLNSNVNDPDIATLYSIVNTAYQAFMQAFNDVQLNYATYRSKTMITENLLSELSSKKARQWDIMVQSVYLDNTPEYIDIMPNGRGAFQKGTYEERINAISIFFQKLAAYPNLALLQNDVDSFFQLISAARTSQQGLEYIDSQLRKNVETKRQELAIAMHKSFAFLLFKYGDTPDKVESYFELQYLKANNNTNSQSVSLQAISINANSRKVVLNNQVTTGTFITIKNKSNVPISLFVSSDVNVTSSTAAIILQGGEEEYSIPAEALAEDSNAMGNLILINQNIVDANVEIGIE